MTRIAPMIVALFLFVVSLAQAASDKPNILLICVDDLKPMLGCYGDTTIKSPNIDRLAARGMRFDCAYCNQAVCAPSRNALLTGLRPQTIGIYDLGTNFRKAVPNAITLPQYFKAHGYHTEGLGKIYHSGHGNHDDAASWSVPHWNANIVHYALAENRSSNSQSREAALFANARGDDAKELPRGAAYESADVADNVYPDGLLADEAIQRLETAASSPDTPFFIAVGFLKPHLPFCAPKKYWDMYDPASFKLADRKTPPDGAPPFAPTNWGELRNYANMPEKGPVSDEVARKLIHGYHAAVSFSDAQIGRVLDAVDKNGLAKNTIIVLWGDHGWHLGDHGMWCKHTNYEEATHIPLLVIDPRATHSHGHTSALVESVDLYPTLCDLAGLPVPTGLDGASFNTVLQDTTAKTKDAVLHVYPRGKLLGRSVRTARYRLVEWKEPGASRDTAVLELYDYESDPGENKNLAEEKPDVVNELRATLYGQPEAKPQIEKTPGGKHTKSAKQGKNAQPKTPNKRRARSDVKEN
jgi:iduronate 2-sulfatase